MNKQPIKTIEEAQKLIESFRGNPADFRLAISDELQDPIGINIAIITDFILKKGWMPDGFDEEEGYRVYRYKSGD
jgi:hypothetical protein